MEPYRTNDLYIAALFLALGEKLLSTVTDKGKVFWVFVPSSRIPELEIEWANSTIMVSAHGYAEALRTLKAHTFRGKP